VTKISKTSTWKLSCIFPRLWR